MEELNNNVLVEEIIETVEPVEVLDSIESVKPLVSKEAAIGAVVITGLIAGGIGLKKLWDKRKAKKSTVSTVTVEFKDEVVEEKDEVVEEKQEENI